METKMNRLLPGSQHNTLWKTLWIMWKTLGRTHFLYKVVTIMACILFRIFDVQKK